VLAETHLRSRSIKHIFLTADGGGHAVVKNSR
jgi:hypothetical protein